MQLKKIVITALILGTAGFANGQQKKVTPKATGQQPATKTTTSAQGINQQNYGTVVEYLNGIVHCMNEQQEVIENKDDYYRSWSDYFVYDKPGSKNRVVYSPFAKIDMQRSSAFTSCDNATAPTIMGTEANFYNENYKSLRETFTKIAMQWNEMSHYGNATPPDKETGKRITSELIAQMDKYHEIRKNIGIHNNQLQNQLFPYSVANSPYKDAYINVHSDLNAIENFAGQYTNVDDMIQNKDVLSANLTGIENAAKEHVIFATTNNVPHAYQDFYEAVNKYIFNTRKLLNSKSTSNTAAAATDVVNKLVLGKKTQNKQDATKSKNDAIDNYNLSYKFLFTVYNQVMSGS